MILHDCIACRHDLNCTDAISRVTSLPPYRRGKISLSARAVLRSRPPGRIVSPKDAKRRSVHRAQRKQRSRLIVSLAVGTCNRRIKTLVSLSRLFLIFFFFRVQTLRRCARVRFWFFFRAASARCYFHILLSRRSVFPCLRNDSPVFSTFSSAATTRQCARWPRTGRYGRLARTFRYRNRVFTASAATGLRARCITCGTCVIRAFVSTALRFLQQVNVPCPSPRVHVYRRAAIGKRLLGFFFFFLLFVYAYRFSFPVQCGLLWYISSEISPTEVHTAGYFERTVIYMRDHGCTHILPFSLTSFPSIYCFRGLRRRKFYVFSSSTDEHRKQLWSKSRWWIKLKFLKSFD